MRWGDELTLAERYWWVRGLMSRKRSCGRKQRFDTPEQAEKGAASMARRSGREFDVYHCAWGRHWHFGGSVRR